ncbi:zinc ribbon domain-containing protein [Occallatibacter riparius]|uniref:C4-type zinc ribbon domain-containing protein n=1 Tax=Occallatibacter riparius TaxID=1002689 RepID=A0A9J7BVB5_9BACT|nr:C4-type zinc ribbon domain-containing protein [Occallatibacter riparius]UWZ84846.1 C4-type zinc ribbon domain-containing protein [Occallatibacter riparius]
MLPLVENLIKLQAVEVERARLAQTALALPAEIAQAQSALDKAQGDLAAQTDALAREEALRTRLERDIKTHRDKATRYRGQLDSITTPAQAQAIEHEISFAESEIDRLENEELASLERTDQHESALAEARTQVEWMANALVKTRERICQRQKECATQQAELTAEREKIRRNVDPDWLVRFDRIAAHRGTAVAKAENQQCTGCRMGIRPQIWNQVREGELLTCDSCGRILYWDPAMTAPVQTAAQAMLNPDPPAVPKPRRIS